MPWFIWASVGIAVCVFGLAVLEGYLCGRAMDRSVEGVERLH